MQYLFMNCFLIYYKQTQKERPKNRPSILIIKIYYSFNAVVLKIQIPENGKRVRSTAL